MSLRGAHSEVLTDEGEVMLVARAHDDHVDFRGLPIFECASPSTQALQEWHRV